LDNTAPGIYQHPTGGYREAALEAIDGYLALLSRPARHQAAGERAMTRLSHLSLILESMVLA
jgi:hypothetical protein